MQRLGSGTVLAAVLGLVAALSLGVIGQAKAVAAEKAPVDRWSDAAHGFASLAGGTTGGAGGKVVTVTDQASPAAYAAAEEPYVIRVSGAIAVQPFGSDIVVGSDKTIIGVGHNAGPGAAPSADRPQLDAVDVRTYTVANYLKGTDGWAPHARH
ncbi:hypothetical protein [Streptomyces canus]|uniref:hypothetical protein n=1 Tax=Streptomyces canus TaxID=58343 RepID=UPI0005261AA7|nr:hypothetical protein [Streptomyces canus]